MRVTLNQIAEMANVSRGTVDKVLHNRPGVSDAVRERVKRVAEELHYVPNMIGKALATCKKQRVIAVILTMEDNPFIVELKKGVIKAYEEIRDYGFVLDIRAMKTNEPAELAAILHELLENGVDAIALPTFEGEGVRCEIQNAYDKGIPVVTFISDLPGIQRLCFIGHDIERGGRVAGALMGRIVPSQWEGCGTQRAGAYACASAKETRFF